MQYSLENIQEIADLILKKTDQIRFFLLYGEMGTGKTTLVRTIFQKIDIQEPITSPTFTYINIYYSSLLKKNIYHLDLYRLSSLDEFYALGLDEFLEDQHALVFIEWPELIEPIIKKIGPFCELILTYVPDINAREIIIREV